MNADNNHKDRIHIIYGDKHYDAAVGIYHGNNDLDDSRKKQEIQFKTIKTRKFEQNRGEWNEKIFEMRA